MFPFPLTETMIRQRSQEQSYARGRDYYEGGAVAEMIRRGNQLMAEVEGVNMSYTWSRLPL